jgi:glucose/arabinose dehydrogenase
MYVRLVQTVQQRALRASSGNRSPGSMAGEHSRRASALKRSIAATAVIVMGCVFLAPSAGATSAPQAPKSTNGHEVQLVASGLETPTSFAFGDGHIFEGDGGNSEGSAPPNGGVYVLKNGKAEKIPSALKFVAGLAWHDGRLYVSGAEITAKGPSFLLASWGGWNGKTFTSRRTIYTAPKRFDGFNGIAFGPDGRLYVGVDVGLTDGNDDGPRSTSRFLYDILSLRADGADLRVFATGMRQPWQLAFGKGSYSPYVTDLGQDTGERNPPDFILHVRAGQNYGFPNCNHTISRACRGYAAPFRTFSPHTDLMGIALCASKLYLTSFAGPGGKGPGGEVYSLALAGHTLKPLITGFVAPVVGLGLSNGYLYVGELTGQVYRLKV